MTDIDPKVKKVASSHFLHAHGADLVANGYNIVPIAVNSKRPPWDDWQKTNANANSVNRWLDGGYGNHGVGIITKKTPAIDIDITDDLIAQRVEDWIRENIADAPVRYGNGEKRLMLFRAEDTFVKLQSAKYQGVDECSDQQYKLEILGDGQQFVAYAIHPETKLPYRWVGDDHPLNVKAENLPLLTRDKAVELLTWFEAMAKKEKWVRTGRSSFARAGNVDRDNPFIEDSPPVDLTVDQLTSILMETPGYDDYHEWFTVGMALYHQYDGEEPGLSMWHEWSAQSDKYDERATDKKWKTFNEDGKGRAPTTAATILKMHKEAIKENAKKEELELVRAFVEAKDREDFEAARERTNKAEISMTSRALVVAAARKAFQRIEGEPLSKADATKWLMYIPDHTEKPRWLEHWVFDQVADKFFNLVSKVRVSRQSFDAVYEKLAITKKDLLEGKTAPSTSASQLALRTYQVPVVVGSRYLPTEGTLIHEDGDVVYANSYSDRDIPIEPAAAHMLPRDKRNIDRVQKHLMHLLNDEREARMLLDWIAYIVKNPGDHVNYGVFLQGTEGDGKSFLSMLIRAMIGSSNARSLNAGSLDGKFSGWADGQCFVCLEEVRMVSHNRYEVLNSLKQFITNDIIEVHPKGKDPYTTRNTSSYMLLSNFQDALPITANDRRYLILFSQWQSRERLAEFKAENPDYYENLYQCIEQSAGALRKFFREHKFHVDFNPKDDAPITRARGHMIAQTQSDFIRGLVDVLENGKVPGVNQEIIDLSALRNYLVDQGVEIPDSRQLAVEMNRVGFYSVGQVRFGETERRRVWAKSPAAWTDERGFPLSWKIKQFLDLKPKNDPLEDDEEI